MLDYLALALAQCSRTPLTWCWRRMLLLLACRLLLLLLARQLLLLASLLTRNLAIEILPLPAFLYAHVPVVYHLLDMTTPPYWTPDVASLVFPIRVPTQLPKLRVGPRLFVVVPSHPVVPPAGITHCEEQMTRQHCCGRDEDGLHHNCYR